MKIPSIDEVAKYDDAAMAAFLGQDQELESFKTEIKELAGLSGPAKKEAQKMWDERFKPHVSSDSLKWMREDAVRSTKKGKELLQDTSPSSIDY